MLDQIPNLFKRERRRDVIEKGPDSMHFVIAVQRMVQLLDEMEEALADHRWLVGDEYTLADVAFTPYLLRLEHLDLLGMVAERPRVADWYARCQARASFAEALRKWENREVSHVDEAARRSSTGRRSAPSWLRLEGAPWSGRRRATIAAEHDERASHGSHFAGFAALH